MTRRAAACADGTSLVLCFAYQRRITPGDFSFSLVYLMLVFATPGRAANAMM